jgi:hypothetical protein
MSALASSPYRVAPLPPTACSSALEAVRRQAAFLRALLDEVERLAPAALGAEGVADQLVVEVTRLGRASLEAAAELSQHVAEARVARESAAAKILRHPTEPAFDGPR